MERDIIVISSDSEDETDHHHHRHHHDDLDSLFHMTMDEWNEYCARIAVPYV